MATGCTDYEDLLCHKKAQKNIAADYTDDADFLASLVSSASSALKASFRHRDLPSSTGSFCNAPFVKLTKNCFFRRGLTRTF